MKAQYASGERKTVFDVVEFQRIQSMKAHLPAAKEKRAKTRKENNFQQGSNNSQFNTRWIYSDELRQSKKIAKTAQTPIGWCDGRKIKF